MLSTNLLIDDVANIILDPDVTRTVFLQRLNAANLAIADELLLPDLSDGSDTLTTTTTGYSVSLPSDFHKNIVMASINDESVRVYLSFPLMLNRMGKISTTAGDVTAVCTKGGSLVYQRVPAVSVDIDILYYRLPVAMTDADDSFPDGVSNSVDFENCLKYHASWKSWEIKEDGMEGQKVNTAYHKSMYEESLLRLRRYISRYTGPQASLPKSAAQDLFNV